MNNAIADLLASKTTIMAFVLVLALVVLSGTGHVPWTDVRDILKIVLPVWVGGVSVEAAAAHVTGAATMKSQIASQAIELGDLRRGQAAAKETTKS